MDSIRTMMYCLKHTNQKHIRQSSSDYISRKEQTQSQKRTLTRLVSEGLRVHSYSLVTEPFINLLHEALRAAQKQV